ncbi:hypothetical protein L596_020992 [Steinernema carpocapsae]|uniref:Activin types I and II receptor domain-containing protein n=1 Tax=Steinernema carpocapsae TaxID=34508 RepID=A0A4U5MVE1_STECR|nr:hypothetical protein L596_020992 [Steinernema carpocapsae]
MNSLVLCFLLTFLVAQARHHKHHVHHKRQVADNFILMDDSTDQHFTSKKDFFETVADQKEYISYDDEGKPYMICAAQKAGEAVSKRCYLPSDKPAYDMGLACYTLWQGDTVVQDCWVNQMVSLTQCQKRRCVAPESPMGIQFCCCFGHECNDAYKTN